MHLDDGGISLSAQEDEARERAAEVADDEARVQRWAAFVAVLCEQRFFWTSSWGDVIVKIGNTMNQDAAWDGDFNATVRAFAETEGWPDVLHALGRAMTEEAQQRADLNDRR